MVWYGIFLIALAMTPIQGARILASMCMPSYSHQIVYQPLWKELSLRGHQVTVLTSDPINDHTLVNLTEINMSQFYTFMRSNFLNVSTVDARNFNRFHLYHVMMWWSNLLVDAELQFPEVQEIINNKTDHYDVVLAEFFCPPMYALAERFKCPLITVSTMETLSKTYNSLGNPHHPLINSEGLTVSDDTSTFFNRLLSSAFTFYIKYLTYPVYGKAMDEIVEKHFGKGYPSIEELEKSASLMFVNTDVVMHNVHPLLPTIIPIGGGIHLKPSKPLPADLQQHCDNAKNGFIYFSLGTNVMSHHLPKEKLQMLLDTFAEVPYTVFWKFETDELSEKPKNLIIGKWFPQQSFLEHPNIRLFITQGGLQSIHESILNKVPMIGVPFVGDQRKNVEKIVEKKMGLKIDIEMVNRKTLKEAILEITGNPIYKQNVEKYANILKDQPMSGLEKAVWWTEYVIRHKGTTHLRSSGVDIPLYQYFLLDVIGFCLGCLSLVIVFITLTVKIVIRLAKFVLFKKIKSE